jgi:phospholipase A1
VIEKSKFGQGVQSHPVMEMDSQPSLMLRPTLTALLLFIGGSALASQQPETLAECATIADNVQRLECYDRLAAAGGGERHDGAARQPVQAPAAANAGDDRTDGFSLDQHWELSPENKRGLFAFRPHRENYIILAHYSAAPNKAPFSPFLGLAPNLNLSDTELKFQLGFKMKLLEDISARHADLWFGYTQQSYWQAYNRSASRPFRETNYQPELMVVAPVDFRFLGMHARFVNLGLAHQSNGQTLNLSRSWNRLYLQTGLEKGNFTVAARLWKRVGDKGRDDDNPDITDYMGHGDIAGTYRWKGHEFSLLARHNFRTDRGATQIAWAFPLAPRLRGYMQLFAGYGQSLIDYNYFQRTIGLGVLIAY